MKFIVNKIGSFALAIILIASPVVATFGIIENWQDLRAFLVAICVIITVAEFLFLYFGISAYAEEGNNESKNADENT